MRWLATEATLLFNVLNSFSEIFAMEEGDLSKGQICEAIDYDDFFEFVHGVGVVLEVEDDDERT